MRRDKRKRSGVKKHVLLHPLNIWYPIPFRWMGRNWGVQCECEWLKSEYIMRESLSVSRSMKRRVPAVWWNFVLLSLTCSTHGRIIREVKPSTTAVKGRRPIPWVRKSVDFCCFMMVFSGKWGPEWKHPLTGYQGFCSYPKLWSIMIFS